MLGDTQRVLDEVIGPSTGELSREEAAEEVGVALRQAAAKRGKKLPQPQAGDEVGRAIRTIIETDATPEQIANMITGSGRIVATSTPARLVSRLRDMFGHGSEPWRMVQEALWKKARVFDRNGQIDPLRTADSIMDLANSTVGKRAFDDQHLRVMRGHAQGIRDLGDIIADIQGRVKPDIGGEMQGMFDRLVAGRSNVGDVADLANAIITGSRSGNAVRAVDAIGHLVGKDSETFAFVRNEVWNNLSAVSATRNGAQAARAIEDFLQSPIAERMFTPQERALQAQYARGLRTTSPEDPMMLRRHGRIMRFLSRFGAGTVTGLIAGLFTERLVGHVAGHLAFPGGYLAGHAVSHGVDHLLTRRGVRRMLQPVSARRTAPLPSAEPIIRGLIANYGGPAAEFNRLNEP